MKNRIEELETRLAAIERELQPLLVLQRRIKQELNTIKSREFIRINGITADDVEMSEGEDKPFFGEISVFAKWLRENSTKKWAEWNTSIHLTQDLLNGKWSNTGAYTDHL